MAHRYIIRRTWVLGKTSIKYNAPSETKLEVYTVKNTTGLVLGDLEWTEFTGLNISDCAVGIKIVKGKRIEFAGSLAGISIRNCSVGICAEAMDDRWGMLIADGVIEGRLESIRNDSNGIIKLSGVALKGKTAGKGEIADDGQPVSGLVPRLSVGYTKPKAKLYVAALKTGMLGDISAEFQKVLDEAGRTGGVVYLPAGTYSLSEPVSVPAGVELRGASSVPTRDQSGKALGTVILCRYGVGDGYGVSAPALITLVGKNAGLSGIRDKFSRRPQKHRISYPGRSGGSILRQLLACRLRLRNRFPFMRQSVYQKADYLLL